MRNAAGRLDPATGCGSPHAPAEKPTKAHVRVDSGNVGESGLLLEVNPAGAGGRPGRADAVSMGGHEREEGAESVEGGFCCAQAPTAGIGARVVWLRRESGSANHQSGLPKKVPSRCVPMKPIVPNGAPSATRTNGGKPAGFVRTDAGVTASSAARSVDS